MRKLTIEELGCKDLKSFSYTYDDIGYCSIGDDYNSKRITITIIPNDLVPDYDDVVKFVMDSRKRLIRASTEERTQIILDRFWNELHPKMVQVKSESNNTTACIYTVVVERKED